jgi:protoporphyrinogen IX oxidase
MSDLVIKSLHIIFVVTWFSGLFYGFRLFVYHAEALKLNDPDKTILANQYKKMERRLWYIISWPSMILTVLFGTWLLVLNPSFLLLPFMHIKLTFVAVLIAYQIHGENLLRKFRKGEPTPTPLRLRMFNEIPTVILVAVVFLVELQDEVSWVWGVISILGLAALLTLAVKWYKNKREKGDPSL